MQSGSLDAASDMLGQSVVVGDLIVYGATGKNKGTRLGRVYKILDPTSVMCYLVQEKWTEGKWVKVRHSRPNTFVLAVDTGIIPKLEDLTD